jgi:hypothetical protein
VFAHSKIGISYRRSPRFDYTSFSGGLAGTQQRTLATFKLPDVLAAGLSVAPTENLVLSGEYTRVFYSQLRSDYVTALVSQGDSRQRRDRFTIDDGGEVHFGAEYLLPIAIRPAIRGGVWWSPDHSVHYQPTPLNDLFDERLGASLSSGRSLWHGTLGTMVELKSRLFLSFAVDHSDRSTVVSTSAVVHF